MRILPISNTNNFNRIPNSKPSFKAHLDFYKFNSTQSCFFRRGCVILANNKGYSKIETIFKELFTTNNSQQKQMLIVGIGNSQEPFSYLASIKGIIGNKSLKQAIDLYTVDLQSKPEEKQLKENAFSDLLDYEKFPEYAEKGFVKDNYDRWLGVNNNEKSYTPIELFLKIKTANKEPSRYRVNDEIFNLVKNTYNNPEKSKWDSRIQETIQTYPENKFDIISANNVLGYINSDYEYLQTLKHIKRTIKHGGYFITDPYDFLFKEYCADFLNNFEKIYEGIYKKK